MVKTCPICVEKYNKSTRKVITCLACNHGACADCHKKYILSCIDVHCMNCHKKWNSEFVFNNFTNSWITKDLREHIKTTLLNREKSQFVNDLIVVEERRRREQFRTKIDDFNLMTEPEILIKIMQIIDSQKIEATVIVALINELSLLHITQPLPHQRLNRVQLHYYRVYQQPQISINKKLLYRLLYQENPLDEAIANFSSSSHERRIIYKCPLEDCQGFLSSQWKCMSCEQYICSRCYEKKKEREDNNHICKKENVESVELIKKDSKPCPKCGTLITKIIGCDQMFCTSCLTPFNWRTMHIITSATFHNPHYTEWQRQHQNISRDPQDVPCGGIPNFFNYAYPDIITIHRVLTEIQGNIALLQQNARIFNHQEDRIRFIENHLDEKSFKTKLWSKYNLTERATEEIQILQMLVDICSGLMREMNEENGHYDGKTNNRDAKSKEIYALVDYVQTCLFKLSVRYKTTPRGFHNNKHGRLGFGFYHAKEPLLCQQLFMPPALPAPVLPTTGVTNH